MAKIKTNINLVNPNKLAEIDENRINSGLGLLSDLVLMGFVRLSTRQASAVCLRPVCIKWGFKYDAGEFRLLCGLVVGGGLRVGDCLVREGLAVRRYLFRLVEKDFIYRVGKGRGLSAYYRPTSRGRLFISECLQALRVEAENDILGVMGWRGVDPNEESPETNLIESGQAVKKKRKRGFTGD